MCILHVAFEDFPEEPIFSQYLLYTYEPFATKEQAFFGGLQLLIRKRLPCTPPSRSCVFLGCDEKKVQEYLTYKAPPLPRTLP